MKEQTGSGFVTFMMRAIVGMCLIYGINQYILPAASSLKVGLNVLSFFLSGALGIPGVGLLYGILLCQML